MALFGVTDVMPGKVGVEVRWMLLTCGTLPWLACLGPSSAAPDTDEPGTQYAQGGRLWYHGVLACNLSPMAANDAQIINAHLAVEIKITVHP